MSKVSMARGRAHGATLMGASGADAVSCLHLHAPTGLVVVGRMNGSVALGFPGAPAVAKGADLELGAGAETYHFVVLKKRSNEGIRTAYVDAETGRLMVAAGDAAIQVWNLNELEEVDGEARCEMYGFQRHHSFGTCVNAHLFQHKSEFVMIVRNSVTVYSLEFPPEAWNKNAAIATENRDAGATQNRMNELRRESELKNPRVQPKQMEASLTTPQNSMPCHYDGKRVVFLRSEDLGEYFFEVRDWTCSEKSIIRSISLKRWAFSQFTPTSVQTLGDFLLAVVDLSSLCVWSIETGRLLYTLKGYRFGIAIVAARLVWPMEMLSRGNTDNMEGTDNIDLRTPYIISLGGDGSVLLWKDGDLLQEFQLSKNLSNFVCHGPYFIEPTFVLGPDLRTYYIYSLVFNDDTGVHKITVKE